MAWTVEKVAWYTSDANWRKTNDNSLVFGSQKFHHFAIPIRRRSTYLHRLRVHGNDDPEVFGDSVEEEPADPEVVAHVDALVRPDLELPLKNQVTIWARSKNVTATRWPVLSRALGSRK